MGPDREYQILVTKHARRSLRRLRKDIDLLTRMDAAIQSLAKHPRPRGSKKLASKKYGNLYRLRVGAWRILYAIEDDRLVVLILDIVRRDQAYRQI